MPSARVDGVSNDSLPGLPQCPSDALRGSLTLGRRESEEGFQIDSR